MYDGSELARQTWIRQLRDSGVTRHEIEAGFDRLLWLQCRDNEFLVKILSKNNRVEETHLECPRLNTLLPTKPQNVSLENSRIIPEQSGPPQNTSSVNTVEDLLNNSSQLSSEENLIVLPAEISITAIASPSTPKPFKTLDEYGKQLRIREFLVTNSISEHMVSELTRIQLPLLQRYFSGVINAISENAKQILFQWYLKTKSDPKRLQDIRVQFDQTKRKHSELIQGKRERFIFRKQHIEILEKYFNENKYPDLFLKEDIARECNEAVVTLTGTPVPPREQVTVSIVSNWFNNKRKEAKLKLKTKKQRVNHSKSDPKNDNNVVNIVTDSEYSNSSSIFSNSSLLYSDGFKTCDSVFSGDLSDVKDLNDIPEIIVNKPKNMKTNVEDDKDIEELIIK